MAIKGEVAFQKPLNYRQADSWLTVEVIVMHVLLLLILFGVSVITQVNHLQPNGSFPQHSFLA